MIANALRAEIDRYAVRARRENPLYSKASDGTLSPEMVTRYIANVHRMVARSPADLARARDRSKALGLPHLAEYFDQKRGEEVGHDAWSARDLKRMAKQVEADGLHEVLPAIQSLMNFIERIIDEDPTIYLSYVLFAEYLVVVLGPDWVSQLETRCGIPRTSVTVIGNHIELDKEHVEEALDRIDELVGDARKLPRMREVLLQTFEHFDRFCVEATDSHHESSSAGAVGHISAA
jgi:pyrroloquinoline quinone (PQQ) biosynthesis protein C